MYKDFVAFKNEYILDRDRVNFIVNFIVAVNEVLCQRSHKKYHDLL